MNSRTTRNIPHSARRRLLDLSRSTGRDYMEIVTRYAYEGVIRRLAASDVRNHFVVKGAMLIEVWRPGAVRTTRDLDVLGLKGIGEDNIAEKVGRFIALTPGSDDGLRFDPTSVTVSPIRQQDPYGGYRCRFDGVLDTVRLRMQIDVGLGDSLIPSPVSTSFPGLLGLATGTVLAYRPELSIAEKFHAMVIRGELNSRMKDYFDIHLLAKELSLSGPMLQQAVRTTFGSRATPIPEARPAALTAAFAHSRAHQDQWKAWLTQQGFGHELSLSQTVDTVRALMAPVCLAILNQQDSPDLWQPGGPWSGEWAGVADQW